MINKEYQPVTMSAKGIALLLVMLFSFSVVHAQRMADTLDEIKVHGRHRERQVSNDERINTFSPGQKVKSLDSITLQEYKFQSMANLLTQQVPVFIKSYGINGTATLNFRGASAAQSQVYWNGVPIQNAALGMSDVSLLPVSLMDKVNIVYGGSSALWGSGNVGGALLIENDKSAYDSIRHNTGALSLAAFSYRHIQVSAKMGWIRKRWYANISVLADSVINDFKYRKNSKEVRMQNAAASSTTAMVHSAYKISSKDEINLSAWLQWNNRQIPPALFDSISVRKQKDASVRTLLEWQHKGKKADLYAKTSYVMDYLEYNDSLISLHSKNTCNQLYGEAGMKMKVDRHNQFLLFTPIQLSWMNIQSDTMQHKQNRVALAGAWAIKYFNDRLNVSLTAREEQVNKNNFFLPGVNISFALLNWLSLKGNMQKSYRVPTLNELYYIPGGNPDLKPEHGWSEDLGYLLQTNEQRRISFHHEVDYFNRLIHDWIIWFGGSIWTPHNIATVHSRGIETENSLTYKLGNWHLHFGLNTAYVLATTVQSYLLNDGSIGKQIPYSPLYNGQANIGFSYKGLYFNYNHTYTGYRYVTTDESQWVEPYNTGNIQVLYTPHLKKNIIQLTFQLNNVWNQQYQVVNSRPMPGFNWLSGFSIQL